MQLKGAWSASQLPQAASAVCIQVLCICMVSPHTPTHTPSSHLTYTRVDPEQPLVAYALEEFSKISCGSGTGTVGP